MEQKAATQSLHPVQSFVFVSSVPTDEPGDMFLCVFVSVANDYCRRSDWPHFASIASLDGINFHTYIKDVGLRLQEAKSKMPPFL